MTTDSKNNDSNEVNPEATFMIDHVSLDIDIIHPDGHAVQDRPIVTCLVDSRSGYVLGYHVETTPGAPDYRQLMECVINTVHPRDDCRGAGGAVRQDWPISGLPSAIVVDNGDLFVQDSDADHVAYTDDQTLKERAMERAKMHAPERDGGHGMVPTALAQAHTLDARVQALEARVRTLVSTLDITYPSVRGGVDVGANDRPRDVYDLRHLHPLVERIVADVYNDLTSSAGSNGWRMTTLRALVAMRVAETNVARNGQPLTAPSITTLYKRVRTLDDVGSAHAAMGHLLKREKPQKGEKIRRDRPASPVVPRRMRSAPRHATPVVMYPRGAQESHPGCGTVSTLNPDQLTAGPRGAAVENVGGMSTSLQETPQDGEEED